MELRDLADTIASGDAMLFTGAGFSSDARDRAGAPLPDGQQMVAELWPIVFGDGEPDGSSLADLYDAALLSKPRELAEYVSRRLRVGDTPLPPHYPAWLGAPWRRIYTLNVDDLERAVQRLAHPFVFVGTTLDEVVLWQHLELSRRKNGNRAARPVSCLISASLSRARRVLLESLQIRWIEGTIAEVAEQLFRSARAVQLDAP